MALWGKLDAANSAPKWLSNTSPYIHGDLDNIVFVDSAEVSVAANRAKGLVTPGWNIYYEYQDQNGNTRRVVEPLVAMKVSAAAAGDLGITGNTTIEDAILVDPVITISTQPAAETANSTTNAVFTVVATVNNNGVLAYQWQSGNSTVFADVTSANGVSGETSDTLTLEPDAALHTDDTYFRVVISSDGAETVTSNSALLTVS